MFNGTLNNNTNEHNPFTYVKLFSVIRVTDRLHMVIVIDWDVDQQNKTNKQNLVTHLKLASVIRLNDRLHMTVVDWGDKQQNKQT